MPVELNSTVKNVSKAKIVLAKMPIVLKSTGKIALKKIRFFIVREVRKKKFLPKIKKSTGKNASELKSTGKYASRPKIDCQICQ